VGRCHRVVQALPPFSSAASAPSLCCATTSRVGCCPWFNDKRASGAEVLRNVERPTPSPAPGEVLIKAARESRSFVHIGIAAAVWATATAVAVLCYSGRGIQIAETEE
jgi:hypothetical protein